MQWRKIFYKHPGSLDWLTDRNSSSRPLELLRSNRVTKKYWKKWKYLESTKQWLICLSLYKIMNALERQSNITGSKNQINSSYIIRRKERFIRKCKICIRPSRIIRRKSFSFSSLQQGMAWWWKANKCYSLMNSTRRIIGTRHGKSSKKCGL